MICSHILRRLAFAGLALTAAPLFAADVTSTWSTAASGVWNANGNWINVPALGGFPNNGNGGVATYDAVISATGSPYTVTLNTNITVEDLTLSSANATINHTAGTFTATGAIAISAGAFQLNGGTISNTVINQSGTGSLVFSTSLANRLSGVTVNGDLQLDTGNAVVRIEGGTTFTTAHLAGAASALAFAPGQTITGTVLFEGAAGGSRILEMNATPGTVTIGATGVLRTTADLGTNAQIGGGVYFGGAMTLVNEGLISSQTSGRTIGFTLADFTNTGTIEAINGGALIISNAYTQTAGVTRVNVGTITSPAINLVAGTLEGTGTINAVVNSSGIINFGFGGTITSTLNATGGSWAGQGAVTGLATVGSGTFTIGSGAHMRANGGLNVTGTGMIAAADGTGKITGSVSYLSSANSTFSGIIAGAGKTLTLNNAAVTLTLAGASTYTGATTITAGTLKAGGASVPGTSGAFGRNSAVAMANSASAMLDITGFDTQIGSLSGGGASGGNVLLGGATLTFGGNNTSPAVYSGTISGSGGISKFGSGTQTLNALNSYTGLTTVGGGTLRLDFASLATPTNLLNSASALTLAGGTLNVLGKTGAGVITSQTLGNVTLSTGTFSTIAPDPNNSGAGSTTLTLGNVWTHNPGSTLLLDYSSANTGVRRVVTTGAVTGGGAAGPSGLFGYALVRDSGGTGFARQDGSFAFIRNTTAGTVLTTSNSIAGTTAIDFTTVRTDPGYSGGTLTLGNVAHAANTLSIDTTSGGTLNLGGTSGVLALTSNAVLVQGAGNYTIQNGALGASGSEVIVHHIGSGVLTISSPISGGAGALTKDGGGTLTLTGSQNYATLTTSGGITNLPVALGTGSSTLNANARTNLSTSQTLAALNIGDSGIVTLTTQAPAPAAGVPGIDLESTGGVDSESAVESINVSLPGGDFLPQNDLAVFHDVTLATGAGQAVPEPGSLGLLLLGAMTMLRRSRTGNT